MTKGGREGRREEGEKRKGEGRDRKGSVPFRFSWLDIFEGTRFFFFFLGYDFSLIKYIQ